MTPSPPPDTRRPADRCDASRVAIVRTGAANLASVRAAFMRLGCDVEITQDAATVRDAAIAVLPGVGAFGPAMLALRQHGLDIAIVDRVRRNHPLLAICLGMQLLAESSQESPGIAGLGVIAGTIRRFPGPDRVPQMGWNLISPADPRSDAPSPSPSGADPTSSDPLLRPAHMYFANSFRLEAIPPSWSGAVANYGGPFVAALERGPVLACQFHPELSGAAGRALLRRWLDRARATRPSRAASTSDTLPSPLTARASTC